MTRSATYFGEASPVTTVNGCKTVGPLPYANRPTDITSGTYTPTTEALGVNLNSVSYSEAQYLRVGNVVTVSGLITINVVAANTPAHVWVHPPFASAFANDREAAGVLCAMVDNEPGAVFADAAEQAIEFYISNPTAADTNIAYAYHYTYRVIE